MHRLPRICFALLALAGFATAHAADDEDNLLPVEKAFQYQASAVDRSTLRIRFKIADDYYLYRERIKTKSSDPSITFGALDLPAGEKKHDEFLGDMQVYHHGFVATQHFTAPATVDKVAFELHYQGCHQVDPKICFPPQKVQVSVDLPKAGAGTGSDGSGTQPLAAALSDVTGVGPALGGEPLPVEQAFVFEAIATGPDRILARFTMPKGYYLYRDKTSFALVDADDASLEPPQWPAGMTHTDENFGTTTVYYDQVEVPLRVARNGTSARTVTVETHLQGCLENRVCYPVSLRRVNVDLPAGRSADAGSTHAATAGDGAGTTAGGDSRFAQALRGSLGFAFLVFFVAGLGLAFTPCVFPMIPILSGIIAGAGENISTRRALILSLVYVLANAVVFTIAGVIAGIAGKNLQVAFQTPWLLWAFAGLFVLLALSMFGFYELQLPSSWQTKLAGVSNRQSGGSLLGVAIMGALSALIVGPCVTPPLAVAVLYIAQTHSPALGGFALFALGLGMGAPLVVFGAGAGRLLPRAGAWMDAVKSVFGVTFLALAVWMLSRVLDTVWIMLLSGILAIGCAVYLGALERLPEGVSGWRRLWKALGIVLLIAGAAELVGAAAGSNDLLQPLHGLRGGGGPVAGETAALPFKRVKSIDDVDRALAAAKAAGQPAMLDFYADWCVSCKEMEKFTFSDPRVRSALDGFALLQADVTANDAADQQLMRQFDIVAPPDTLFFGADGSARKDLQLTGPESADKFLERIAAVKR